MTTPKLSVCIPTRNGAAWIAETIASVTSQDVDLEVVVSDDASSDATVDLAASSGDVRVRVERSPARLGMAANWNRAIELSSGPFVKVLMQDDALLPDVLAVQVELLERFPSAAFAFGPRLLEGDGSREAEEWIAKFSVLHRALVDSSIDSQLLSGALVVHTLTRGRLQANAIGEPSVVLMRRSAIEEVGPFDVRLRQLTDLEFWLRMASVADVAFDSRPVARFRVHASSTTRRNTRNGDAWLDRLRVVKALAENPRTAGQIHFTHFAAAMAAGVRDLGSALFRRRRSLATTAQDIRTFAQRRSANLGEET